MHIHRRLILVKCFSIVISLLLVSCGEKIEKYTIGVSQCSEDSWRSKLEQELVLSTYFNENVELKFLSADDNVEQQCNQIQQLIDENVDLLIVSPQQTSSLSNAIKKAANKHIPVILFDRKSDVEDYTAFMGADNYAIGQMLGEYVAAQLGYKGNVVEIAGEHDSSPALERHLGFSDAIKKHPNLNIVGFAEGDWKQPSGEKAMTEILSKYDGTIDCVFGGNDRMALGARKAILRHSQLYPERNISPSKILFVGVDALPTAGGGIECVNDGTLNASAIYPTYGYELMNLALAILEGKPYEKMNNLETSLVTSANANVLLMQYQEIAKQDTYIKRMHARVNHTLSILNSQRMFLFFAILISIVIGSLLIASVHNMLAKNRLYKELEKKNEELNMEMEIAERQRDELEEQRDKLLDMTTRKSDDDVNIDDEKLYKNEFVEKFLLCINSHMSDSGLSVEDIAQELCLSRVQLYRKVKMLTGKTPVEIIREERLKRGAILLADSSLSVSEIAYRVGFSAPSYFTKCYKDYYGKSPSASK